MSIRVLGAVLIVLAGTQTPAPAPARPVPVAANTLASGPDAFYGQVVSVTAPVDRTISPTAFVLSGRLKNAGRPAPDVLVIVPTLTAPPAPGTHVTIVGTALRFDPAEMARRAADYRFDVEPAMLSRYEGGPAILATVVMNAAFVDLAKRVPPPLTPEEDAFDKVMKRVGPAFNELRAAAGASNAAATGEHARVLQAAFADVEAFWKKRGAADARNWTGTARTQLTALERAAGAGNWEQVKTAVAEVNRSCSACHTAYRERLEDGTFRLRK